MEKYDVSINLEPKDKYAKAKQDFITFLLSYDELSKQEQHQLLCELFGESRVNIADEILHIFRL